MNGPGHIKLPTVLVIDDEVRSQEALRRTLEEDFEVLCASSAEAGMEIMQREAVTGGVQIVLCDQRMPGTTGVEFLKEVRSRWPDAVRIILSGYTDAEDIITGVNEAGIWQYLLKPWQPEQILLILQRAAEVWRLQQDNQRLSLELRTAEPVLKRRVESKYDRVKHAFGLGSLIRAPGSALNEVCDMVARIAPHDLSVMVTGESGTGKEMVARAIHERSHRAKAPFVPINCGAIPRELLESELFGHEKGAFTGAYRTTIGTVERAKGGTLFLDEIGELPLELQVKLLRFLQEFSFTRVGGRQSMQIDLRIISATNSDLKELTQVGHFREDLYYRLDVINIHLPPLRLRGDDSLIMANVFLKRYAKKVGKDIRGFNKQAVTAILTHQWTGNVRELINCVRRGVVLAEGPWLTPENLGLVVAERKPLGILNGRGLKEAKAEFEAKLVAEVLSAHQGNSHLASKDLKISRSMLYHLVQKYNLTQYLASPNKTDAKKNEARAKSAPAAVLN